MAPLKTVIVAPMTTKGFLFPTRIKINFADKDGLILLDQIRTVDKSRLVKKVGIIPIDIQYQVSARLQELFAF